MEHEITSRLFLIKQEDMAVKRRFHLEMEHDGVCDSFNYANKQWINIS